jgi:succinate dehydrogenase hydrophobic anchor subunit
MLVSQPIWDLKMFIVEEATFVGTPTFWVIIVSAVVAVLVVVILIVALVNMKKRNDEIVAAVTRLDDNENSSKTFNISNGIENSLG